MSLAIEGQVPVALRRADGPCPWVPVFGAQQQLLGDEIRTADVADGSTRDGHAVELTARKLTSKLSGHTADVPGRQCPAMSRRPSTAGLAIPNCLLPRALSIGDPSLSRLMPSTLCRP